MPPRFILMPHGSGAQVRLREEAEVLIVEAHYRECPPEIKADQVVAASIRSSQVAIQPICAL